MGRFGSAAIGNGQRRGAATIRPKVHSAGAIMRAKRNHLQNTKRFRLHDVENHVSEVFHNQPSNTSRMNEIAPFYECYDVQDKSLTKQQKLRLFDKRSTLLRRGKPFTSELVTIRERFNSDVPHKSVNRRKVEID